eukprot:4802012-Pyramimonas_sp.AAC.1
MSAHEADRAADREHWIVPEAFEEYPWGWEVLSPTRAHGGHWQGGGKAHDLGFKRTPFGDVYMLCSS